MRKFEHFQKSLDISLKTERMRLLGFSPTFLAAVNMLITKNRKFLGIDKQIKFLGIVYQLKDADHGMSSCEFCKHFFS